MPLPERKFFSRGNSIPAALMLVAVLGVTAMGLSGFTPPADPQASLAQAFGATMTTGGGSGSSQKGQEQKCEPGHDYAVIGPGQVTYYDFKKIGNKQNQCKPSKTDTRCDDPVWKCKSYYCVLSAPNHEADPGCIEAKKLTDLNNPVSSEKEYNARFYAHQAPNLSLGERKDLANRLGLDISESDKQLLTDAFGEQRQNLEDQLSANRLTQINNNAKIYAIAKGCTGEIPTVCETETTGRQLELENQRLSHQEEALQKQLSAFDKAVGLLPERQAAALQEELKDIQLERAEIASRLKELEPKAGSPSCTTQQGCAQYAKTQEELRNRDAQLAERERDVTTRLNESSLIDSTPKTSPSIFIQNDGSNTDRDALIAKRDQLRKEANTATKWHALDNNFYTRYCAGEDSFNRGCAEVLARMNQNKKRYDDLYREIQTLNEKINPPLPSSQTPQVTGFDNPDAKMAAARQSQLKHDRLMDVEGEINTLEQQPAWTWWVNTVCNNVKVVGLYTSEECPYQKLERLKKERDDLQGELGLGTKTAPHGGQLNDADKTKTAPPGYQINDADRAAIADREEQIRKLREGKQSFPDRRRIVVLEGQIDDIKKLGEEGALGKELRENLAEQEKYPVAIENSGCNQSTKGPVCAGIFNAEAGYKKREAEIKARLAEIAAVKTNDPNALTPAFGDGEVPQGSSSNTDSRTANQRQRQLIENQQADLAPRIEQAQEAYIACSEGAVISDGCGAYYDQWQKLEKENAALKEEAERLAKARDALTTPPGTVPPPPALPDCPTMPALPTGSPCKPAGGTPGAPGQQPPGGPVAPPGAGACDCARLIATRNQGSCTAAQAQKCVADALGGGGGGMGMPDIGGLLKGMGGGGGGKKGGGSAPAGNQTPSDRGTCSPQYLCANNQLYYRNDRCVDQPVQACQYGCQGNTCKAAPDSGGGTTPTAPTATISCQPTLADVGMTVAISYSCSAGVSVGRGFDTGGAQSGSATKVTDNPLGGATSVTYAVTCSSQGLTGSSQCTIQINKPSIVLVANPKAVQSGKESAIGWVTAGMQSCVVSSPEQADFTARNAGNTSASGIATTSPVTTATNILLTCQTLAGGTRVASTTVTVQ